MLVFTYNDYGQPKNLLNFCKQTEEEVEEQNRFLDEKTTTTTNKEDKEE